jgi:hypothetical protein
MIDNRIEMALQANEPVESLRKVALTLLTDGLPREAVLDAFDRPGGICGRPIGRLKKMR